MCSTRDGFIYLLGGRSEESQWEEIKTKGHQPTNLQEHTMIEWNNKLYVFGGEVGVSSNGDTPLWILDIATNCWRKPMSSPMSLHPGSSGMQPSGRRGHSAVLYGDAMHVYGGYQDLKGASSELWTFDLSFEEWHLMSCSGRMNEQPSPRHSHSAVVHNNCLWIYGGMTDLQEKSDFWKWDFGTRQWTKIKTKFNPGGLHSHTAIKAFGSMFVFGGERGGTLLHELWRFNFATETWEKLQTQGMVPNPRCRHTAVANPSLEISMWDNDESDRRVRSAGSQSSTNSQKHNSKAVMLVPSKSISMCFGQQTDSPFHESTSKTLKHFKFRVHPMSLNNMCSRGIDPLSDVEDGENEDVNGNAKSATHNLNHSSSQGNVRKSLKEKITHSRLVRSISTSSYSILHNQNSSGTEALKDELEKLVEESTPQMTRPNALKSVNPNINIAAKSVSYRRMRNKIQKSQSSDAVLESESESNTPQQIRKPRPKSEVIQALQPQPSTEETGDEWDPSQIKRRTFHESMSYYSLCFPSPPLDGKSTNSSSVSVGGSPSTPNENTINNNNINSNLNNPLSGHRFSSIYDGHFVSTLNDFEEEEDDYDETVTESSRRQATQLIEFDDNFNGIITSPTDVRPKSSAYTSLVTLNTPGIESRGISHSASHSSGYHSFVDESMYDQKDIAIFQPSVTMRRNRPSREFGTNIELKQLNARLRDNNINQNVVAENGVQLRLQKENRTRSLDRSAVRNSRKQTEKPKQQIPIIEEIVVPNSPATRKWAHSPAKSRLNQHNWRLCMFVFGGREQGVSPVYKQPISVWKLYI
ncbi:uncharacterized protein B4U80_08685 [Leptotrombidium deliense]|uniref:Uncharacterized protein n=1 Tax=Leptotrombidium deliense TaxID=299467 RepID=A0A443SQ33_9ACAR|nr:uncharacterized protein B4U80_08685 [Leptotrombidium deliense]